MNFQDILLFIGSFWSVVSASINNNTLKANG